MRMSCAGSLPLNCHQPFHLILVVHPRSADRSLRHAALLRLLFPAVFFSTHAAFASALPTDLAFATARDPSPLHRFDQRQIPSQPKTNTTMGKETHDGEGAKAAAPPMRARMARTRMVEVDGRERKGMTDNASEASETTRAKRKWLGRPDVCINSGSDADSFLFP